MTPAIRARVLIVAENPERRLLARREIARQMPAARVEEVEDGTSLTVALNVGEWDLVVAADDTRQSDGVAALPRLSARASACPMVALEAQGSIAEAIRSGLEAARRERALAEAEIRDRALFEGVPIGLVRLSREGDILAVNAAFANIAGSVSDAERKALEGSRFVDLCADEADHRKLVAALATEGSAHGLEARLRRRAGGAAPVELDARAVYDARGRLLHYDVAVQDVSERRRFDDKADEIDRLKTEVIADVSHELRTPLNAIVGYIDVLADELASGAATARQTLARLRQRTVKLCAVVQSVVTVERFAAAADNVTVSRFDLRALGDELRADALALDDERVTLEWHVLASEVENDRDKLRRIGYELLSNAIKFTPAGTVSIQLARTPTGGILLAVRDSGIGMSEESRASMVDGSADDRLGLGLDIVRRYTALLRGKVHVASVVGRGTTVTVDVPAASVTPPAGQRRRAPSGSVSPWRSVLAAPSGRSPR